MPFNAVISNQAARRADGYSARQFIVANPATVIFRCQPSAVPAGLTYAQFSYGSVSIGSFNAVKEGQLVIISTDTAMSNILFRGRVRKLPTSSVFYINETSFALQTSHYVSVIDQYDLVERLERIIGPSESYKDFDLPYQNIPPVITNLQSSYVLPTTGSSASLAFAPIAQAMAAGASISSWLWDVADGTITVGSTTTQNITVSFPVGYRWVILRVTDSNNVTTRFCMTVWVGNPDSASDGQLLRSTEGASISASWDDGINAQIEWFDGLTNVLPGTRITIWSEHRYGDGSSATTVDFVGYLQDDEATLSGDESYGQTKAARVNAYGFATILGRLKIPSARLVRKASPSTWGEIASPTPARVLTYALAWHTTLLNLCAVQWETTDADYTTDDLDLEQYQALELMVELLRRYNAQPTFAPSGEIRAARNGCYLSTAARNALPTITTLTTRDVLSISIKTTHTPPVGSLILPAIGYTSSTDVTTAYMAKAPAVAALYSGEERTVGSQILKADTSDAARKTELVERAGHEFAYINRGITIAVELIDSYSDLVPANDQWFILQLSSIDNILGKPFTNERWQLIDLSVDVDSAEGVRTVSATLQIETRGGNAQVLATQLATSADIPHPNIPAVGPFDTLDRPWNSPTTSALDLNYSPLSQDLGRGTPPGNRYPAGSGCEVINVPTWTNHTVNVQFTPISFKTYDVEVLGSFVNTAGTPISTSWQYTNLSSPFVPPAQWGFTSTKPLMNIALPGYGQYVGGSSMQTTDIAITITLPSLYTSAVNFWVGINGTPTTASPLTLKASYGSVVISELQTSMPNTGGFVLYQITPNDVIDKIELTASVTQTFCVLAVNKFEIVHGDARLYDAFYEWPLDGSSPALVMGSGDGLFFNSVKVPAPSNFTPTSAYTFQVTPTIPNIAFRYENPSYVSTRPRTYLIIRVCPREVI